MHEFKLFPKTGKVFVAVSGGLDSMALLQFFLVLRKQKIINELEVVHIHHGLRKASDKEAQFIIEFCQENDLVINYMRLIKPRKLVNVEAWARVERYKFFKQVCGSGDYLATAHHLDDSFEWWLMNSLKSSSTEIPGIPVRNNQIIRPFLCVTKNQIKHYAAGEELEFFEDESNLNNQFERNFIRNLIIPQLQTRYPKLLKHYALRSLRSLSKNTQNNFTEFTYPWGSHFLFEINNVPPLNTLLNSIKRISSSERGQVSKELLKLKTAIENGKKGPMSFSGGVKVFFNRSEILMVNSQGLNFFLKMDQQLFIKLQKNQFNEITTVEEFLRLRKNGQLSFPAYVLSNDKKLQHELKSNRQESSLFPKLTRFLIKNNQWFCSGNQVEHHVHKNPSLLKHKLVIINLQDWSQGFKIL